jgi:hypothetical protein
MTCSTDYSHNVKNAIASNPSFKAICDFNIQHFPPFGYQLFYRSLAKGTAMLETHQQLNAYLACYADMHIHKLNRAFCELFRTFIAHGQSIEILDWGCGQAFASCVLVDYVRENNININISRFSLIEPSIAALRRGSEHLDAIYQRIPKPDTVLLNESADDIRLDQLQTSPSVMKIHLFSNLLDINSINLSMIANTIKSSQSGTNYFVCVSPLNQYRLLSFCKLFAHATVLSQKSDTIKEKVFCVKSLSQKQWNIRRQELIFKTNI